MTSGKNDLLARRALKRVLQVAIGFSFRLVEKVSRVFLTNQSNANANYVRRTSENHSILICY